MKARTQRASECHVVPEFANSESIARLYEMMYGGRELFVDAMEPEQIESSERRSVSPSPARLQDDELLKGQIIVGGLWYDDAIEIVLNSRRHSGTKDSFAPFHWAVLQFARLHTVPSDSSLFDLSPGENSDFFDNYFSRCRSCQKRWWLVDTPVLGICPACEIDVINDALDVKGTLEASPHAPIVRRSAADVVMEPQRATVAGGEQSVDLEEDEDVAMIIPDTIWEGSTIETNPNFDKERYRGWIDLLALDFTRMNQRRPDNPRLPCPMDKDPDLPPDPREHVKMELDD